MAPNNPYCGTCHKAGKSISEYTNHWTRSEPGPNGTITCPLILNSICSYCKQKGHWNKYCPNTPTDPPSSTPSTFQTKLTSWATILKNSVSCHQRHNQNMVTGTGNGHREYIHLNLDTHVDVSIDGSDEFSRPPSPDYPPPGL